MRTPPMRPRSVGSFAPASLLVACALLGIMVFRGSASAEANAGQAAQVLAAALPKLKLAFEKYSLENGLEVVLHEDHRTPVIAVNIWYHVGSKDEARGKNGFAHLFEHLMFQGSKHVPEDTFFQCLERAGAHEHNGTTSDDRTNYFETVPNNQLGLALWL